MFSSTRTTETHNKQTVDCENCYNLGQTNKQLCEQLTGCERLVNVLTGIHLTARRCIDEMDDIIEQLVNKLNYNSVNDLHAIRHKEEKLLQQLVKSEEYLEQLRHNSEHNKQDLSFMNHNNGEETSDFCHNKDKSSASSRRLRPRHSRVPQKLSYSCLGSNSSPNFKCKYSQCLKVFSTINGLRKHERIVHFSSEKMIRCHYRNCNKTFWTQNYLSLHLKYHKSMNNFKTRHESDKIEPIITEKTIDSNIKSETIENSNDCEQEFILPEIDCEDRLRLSNEELDSSKIEEQELLVDPSVLTAQTYKKNLTKQYSRRESSLKCQECGEWFRKDYLTAHMRVHTGEKPYKCLDPNCSKSFAQTSTRNQHYMTHTGEKPHKCEKPNCGREFIKRSDYVKHVNSHDESVKTLNKEKERAFRCRYPNCNKSFGHYCVLIRHEVIHKGIKEFKCNYGNCNYESYWKENLRDHYRRKHNEVFIA